MGQVSVSVSYDLKATRKPSVPDLDCVRGLLIWHREAHCPLSASMMVPVPCPVPLGSQPMAPNTLSPGCRSGGLDGHGLPTGSHVGLRRGAKA